MGMCTLCLLHIVFCKLCAARRPMHGVCRTLYTRPQKAPHATMRRSDRLPHTCCLLGGGGRQEGRGGGGGGGGQEDRGGGNQEYATFTRARKHATITRARKHALAQEGFGAMPQAAKKKQQEQEEAAKKHEQEVRRSPS